MVCASIFHKNISHYLEANISWERTSRHFEICVYTHMHKTISKMYKIENLHQGCNDTVKEILRCSYHSHNYYFCPIGWVQLFRRWFCSICNGVEWLPKSMGTVGKVTKHSILHPGDTQAFQTQCLKY